MCSPCGQILAELYHLTEAASKVQRRSPVSCLPVPRATISGSMLESPNTEFSLLVMTHERPAALQRCLQSIVGLDYDHHAFEVVVIDDGSTADNAGIVRNFSERHPIRYRRIEHRGVAAARNEGYALSRGKLIAFIADDYSLPTDYLRRAEDFFQLYPNAQVLSFGMRSRGRSPARRIQQVYCDLVLLSNANAIPDRRGVIRSFTLPASRAAIFRREALAEVGAFDESLLAGEDGEMGQRLAKHSIPVHFIPNFRIDHWEEKNLTQFLEQRVRYASSWFELSRRRGTAHPAQWTIPFGIKECLNRMRSWAKLSLQTGGLTRFVILSPGLLLFLGAFYLTLYRLNRAERKRAAVARRSEKEPTSRPRDLAEGSKSLPLTSSPDEPRQLEGGRHDRTVTPVTSLIQEDG
jgi:glycosyltransferase involved in cell wall biosynthesis